MKLPCLLAALTLTPGGVQAAPAPAEAARRIDALLQVDWKKHEGRACDLGRSGLRAQLEGDTDSQGQDRSDRERSVPLDMGDLLQRWKDLCQCDVEDTGRLFGAEREKSAQDD